MAERGFFRGHRGRHYRGARNAYNENQNRNFAQNGENYGQQQGNRDGNAIRELRGGQNRRLHDQQRQAADNGAVGARRGNRNNDNVNWRMEQQQQQPVEPPAVRVQPQQQQLQQQERRRSTRLSYPALREMSGLPEDRLLESIATVQSGFPDILNNEQQLQKGDVIALILTCIGKALQSDAHPAAARQLLNNIRTSSFLRQHLVTYLLMMQIETSAPKLRSFKQPIKDCLVMFRQLITQIPSSINGVKIAHSVLIEVVNGLRTRTAIIDDETESLLSEVRTLVDAATEQQIARQTEKLSLKDTAESDAHSKAESEKKPPDNFRDLSVFPDVHLDVHSREKPFLRKIVIKGKFDSVDDYLDIQFRLLREDFIQPLRNGIRDYLNQHFGGDEVRPAGGRQKYRFNDIRVYHDVRILNPVCAANGINYRIGFDINRLKHVNWWYSKRLIYGSLLCLSSDDFNSILIATVSNRDPRQLAEGSVEIQFATNQIGPNIQPGQRFLMVETAAFFESYRPVLIALQNSGEADNPFVENIVYCSREIERPQYLFAPDEPCYDLRAIAGTGQSVGRDDDDDDEYFGRGNDRLANVPVMLYDSWPSAESLNLDLSQLKALHAALTRRVAIIQGPPGTGKTYIGLKIVQTLLENSHVWNEDSVPILVVCYTNHALDQFLEGMSRFLRKGIVRVGGRSKSKAMGPFLLRELRKTVRENREVPRALFLRRKDAYIAMEYHRALIERQAAVIEGTERGLIHEDVLQDVMSEEHYDSLVNTVVPDYGPERNRSLFQTSRQRRSMLPTWLGLVMDMVDGVGQQNANQGVEIAGGGGAAEPIANLDNGEIVENEAQEEEDARRLEIADEDENRHHHQLQVEQQQRRRRNLERANELLAVNFDDLLLDAGNVQVESAAGGTGDSGGDVWELQRVARRKQKRDLQHRLRSVSVMSENDVEAVRDVWQLSIDDRWKIYRYWIDLYVKRIRANIAVTEQDYNIAAASLQEVLEEEDQALMSKMKVIGMTTTAAARYVGMLRKIGPKVIVVEEAAEVLEAHIVSTLSEKCEHLIMIGDHQQLRPSTSVYQLAEEYHMKYSLFERLVINDLPHETLQRQHRMRPEIADVIRLIYHDLVDDESVKAFDSVKGIESNLYFIKHTYDERQDDELKSVSNEHEARYIIALSTYLVQQGYSTSQITVLTPYVGQVFLLRKLTRGQQILDGLRICPVDNFQGEENDIILLSLVRSNYDKKIGFLKEDNRICVALSRAKQGFYAVGNFDLLARCSELWSKIIKKAKEMKVFGESLCLRCQVHPDESKIEAKTAEDFNKAPEGGCMRPCGFRLDCGHVCVLVCHPYDRKHDDYQCRKPCPKQACDKGHKCKRLCYQDCGPCQELVKKDLRCGHTQMVECGVSIDNYRCQEPCRRRLECSHMCQNVCSDDCTVECPRPMSKQCPRGHVIKFECYRRNDTLTCQERCAATLDCDHRCVGTCGTCNSGRLHRACGAECGRTLVCGHACDEPCSDCPPCQRPCENRCNHSRCQRQCGRPCQPCNEKCLWRCQHYQCTMLCHEPCDRPRCPYPCTRKLQCGHECIGMCGETCPTKCRVCHRDDVTEVFFGSEDEPDARFVQLDDCGHIFEVSALDRWIDSPIEGEIQLKKCPRCKITIRRNLRYGTIINDTLRDIEVVKQKIIGTDNENKTKAENLSMQLIAQKKVCSTEYYTFYEEMLKTVGISQNELICIENVFRFVDHLAKLQTDLQKEVKSNSDVLLKRHLVSMNADIEVVKTWLLVPRRRMNRQEARECRVELNRLNLLFEFRMVDSKMATYEYPLLTDDKKRLFNSVMQTLVSDKYTGKVLTDDELNNARQVLKATKECMSGLGITDTERRQIIEAIEAVGQSTKGHWFKCPKGHPYLIGDCGGGNQISKCPEEGCGAEIGGLNHSLVTGNRLATEMDGATVPAWSTMGQPPVV